MLPRNVLILAGVILPRVAAACPNCATALTTGRSAASGAWDLGFSVSVLIMLAVPLVIAVVTFYRISRQLQRRARRWDGACHGAA